MMLPQLPTHPASIFYNHSLNFYALVYTWYCSVFSNFCSFLPDVPSTYHTFPVLSMHFQILSISQEFVPVQPLLRCFPSSLCGVVVPAVKTYRDFSLLLQRKL